MSELTHAGGHGESYCDIREDKPPCRFCGKSQGMHDRACVAFWYGPHAGNRRGLMDDVIQRMRDNDQKHGGPEHDDTHTPSEWCAFIRQWSEKATADLRVSGSMYRSRLIDVAAIAVAAIESYDRRATQ